MIRLILRDSEMHRNAFFWHGSLSVAAIEDWARRETLSVPTDLKELWSLKGGADLFDDSETILQPFGAEDYDLIRPVSMVFWGKGLSTDYYVFHKGMVDSIFRKSDGALFVLKSLDPILMSRVQDLDEWYQKTIRPMYADGYGLAALP